MTPYEQFAAIVAPLRTELPTAVDCDLLAEMYLLDLGPFGPDVPCACPAGHDHDAPWGCVEEYCGCQFYPPLPTDPTGGAR